MTRQHFVNEAARRIADRGYLGSPTAPGQEYEDATRCALFIVAEKSRDYDAARKELKVSTDAAWNFVWEVVKAHDQSRNGGTTLAADGVKNFMRRLRKICRDNGLQVPKEAKAR